MKVSDIPLRVAARVVRGWDDLRYHAKLRLGVTSQPLLLPYRGYVAKGVLRFGGRVVEDEGVVGAEPSASRWVNLKRTFRRYETDEIRNARVAWSACGRHGVAVTNAQGFFDVELACADLPSRMPWAPLSLRLLGAEGYDFPESAKTSLVRIVSREAEYGIISDIDDTIIETGARDLLKHWRTVALNSAEGRVAFPGIAHLYRALAAGLRGGETNPVFYVSSSPWNLYDLFDDFLTLRNIPHGPMFLRDFGLDATQWLTGSHARHKIGAIEQLFDAYPDLGFVLIGDTGQSDAAVYAEIVRRHPSRVLAVLLRDVTPDGFDEPVGQAVAAMAAAGVEVITGDTLQAAAERVEAMGLVAGGTAKAMLVEIERDRKALEDWVWPRPLSFVQKVAAREKPEAGD